MLSLVEHLGHVDILLSHVGRLRTVRVQMCNDVCLTELLHSSYLISLPPAMTKLPARIIIHQVVCMTQPHIHR